MRRKIGYYNRGITSTNSVRREKEAYKKIEKLLEKKTREV